MGDEQASLNDAAGRKERLAADWQDAAITDQVIDPLTRALEKVNSAQYRYVTQATFPIVTRELGETPRVSIVTVIRTTAAPTPMYGTNRQEAPRLNIPVCSCPHFAHRILPSAEDLREAKVLLGDILTDESLRCDHLDAAFQHPDVRDLLDANPDGDDA